VTDDESTSTGYAEAITELEDILEELEGDQLDVDVLAERVRRASELVKVCRERIARARADVDAIVAELDEFDGTDAEADAGNEGDDELF
jgi:exodeoxyribonuclease VII small subunit